MAMHPEWVAGRQNGPPGLAMKVESTSASTQSIPWLPQRGVGHLGTARDPSHGTHPEVSSAGAQVRGRLGRS